MFCPYSLLSLPFLLGLLLLGVSALPFDELTALLPRDVTHIAFDEDTHEFVAFERDGSLHGRYIADMEGLYNSRDTTTACSNLTVSQATSLTGWDSVIQYANDNWGSGSRSIVTNPSQYPGSPAEVCTTEQAVKLNVNGDPTCQTNSVATSGKLVGTNGSVAIAITQGYTATSDLTVTTAAMIGLSETSTVSISFPKVADFSESVTVSGSITNTQASSFTAAYNDLNAVTLTMTAPEGKTCNAISSVTSCTYQATGGVQYIATGWIWFNYEDKTHGHYKWAASLDAILSEDDRSSYATIKGSVAAATHAGYQGTCS